ncbi:MAG: 4Fe-4S dicluster domain-containing protein [Deltaproteobacteria bacterium]|nr:4Fe-4S dicluster domain-containing protein [Deltaproteobacteria bacterium]
MSEEIYNQLRQRMDDLGTGFPPTKNGVEIKILKKIFSPVDAEMFLMLSPMLEYPEKVAERLNLPAKETASHLEDMAKKGLLFRQKKGDQARYAAIPFVVGVFEFQLNRVDSELAADLNVYYEAALGKTFQSFATPVMRTIPINRELVSEWPIAAYEDAMNIVDDQKKIAVAPCICRATAKKAGQGCDKPLETCFLFGSHADYYVDNAMGRYITKDEAKKIIAANDEAGLVMQPFNSQHVGGMCSCCGCCCGMLRSLKKQENPAAAVKSNYFAVVDRQQCVGCETCVDRCQMEAIDVSDEKAVITLKKCIGCGLCVSTCPTGALSLVKKDEADQYLPPQTGMETYMRIANERGKI